jgi:hypothetical protein
MYRSAGSLLIVLSLLIAGTADAHSRSESYSHWYLSDAALSVTVTIPLREVMLLYQAAESDKPPREMFHDHVVANLAVMSGEDVCPMSSSNILAAASGFVRVEATFDCAETTPDTLRFTAMFEAAPSHVHYAKLHVDGRQVGESLFTNVVDTWDIGVLGSGAAYSFTSFLVIGIEHIAGGIDHIAFLMGLLLIAGSVGRSVIAVTGFTLGHSISLAAAVLGYLHADSQLVEAFIGFTVALVAVEYFLLRRSETVRYALICLLVAWVTGAIAVAAGFLELRALFAYLGFGVFAGCYLLIACEAEAHDRRRATLLLFVATCCFGLVHGFGFAGFLMETGLLGTSLFMPLLGFNLGVEIGQLILVAITLVAGTLLGRRLPDALPQVAAAALCGIGVFWFVSRTIA